MGEWLNECHELWDVRKLVLRAEVFRPLLGEFLIEVTHHQGYCDLAQSVALYLCHGVDGMFNSSDDGMHRVLGVLILGASNQLLHVLRINTRSTPIPLLQLLESTIVTRRGISLDQLLCSRISHGFCKYAAPITVRVLIPVVLDHFGKALNKQGKVCELS